MNATQGILCTVYRCSREKEMYVYVNRQDGLEKLPESLRESAGELSEVLTLKLYPERKLARVKAADVLNAIAERGYFLQLPPNWQPAQFTMGE
jgi:uncharacterized protein